MNTASQVCSAGVLPEVVHGLLATYGNSIPMSALQAAAHQCGVSMQVVVAAVLDA